MRVRNKYFLELLYIDRKCPLLKYLEKIKILNEEM